MLRTLLLAAAIASVGSTAMAVEVNETVDTTASPKIVWQAIGKFDGIANWLPIVATSPATKGSKVGSVRTLTLKAPGNPTVTETLTAHAGHSYSYKIDQVDPKVLPVSNYSSTISVAKNGTGSTVTWHGQFDPAGGADEDKAKTAVSGLYRSGLDNIKTMVEK